MKNSAEVIKNSQDEIEESKANLEITRDAIAAAE